MRVLVLATGSILLCLAGCSRPGVLQEYSDEAPARARPPPGPPPAGVVGAAPMLAYSYADGIECPAPHVAALMARHQAACATAGPMQCQVTGSTLETRGKDDVRGMLALRASPSWLARFRPGLAREAKDAGGRQVLASVTSEDLSRQVIDVQAIIRAKTALRDRLQAILESRPGKTADLVEVETALSKVQGELDAEQSEMTAMRLRLDTSVLTIDYNADDNPAREGLWSPLSDSIGQFGRTSVRAIAFMVTCVALLLPWAIVLGGAGWAFRGVLSRTRWPWRQRANAEAPPSG